MMEKELTPLNDLKEQREARELAEGITSGKADGLTYTLAWLLLRALAQIEALSLLADPVAQRMSSGNHRYPELTAVGLGHLWVGPGFNDFAPGLIEACRKHLKTLNLPAQKGHALDYIRNRIREQNWGALEQRWEERPKGRAGSPTPKEMPKALPMNNLAPPFGTPAYWDWVEKRKLGNG